MKTPTTLTSSARRRGKRLVGGVVLVAAAFALYLLVSARQVPYDAPLARMYRTEANLIALRTAIDTYHRDTGEYPPAGTPGLRLATQHLSRTARYFPNGPPADAWDHSYRYIPHSGYDAPGSAALRGPGGFFAPETYQLYSVGRDGVAGLVEPSERQDNISAWDGQRPWRAHYRTANVVYRRAQKEQP